MAAATLSRGSAGDQLQGQVVDHAQQLVPVACQLLVVLLQGLTRRQGCGQGLACMSKHSRRNPHAQWCIALKVCALVGDQAGLRRSPCRMDYSHAPVGLDKCEQWWHL
eukprot:1144733-Pelagomonas_calceolata.AAC.7